MKWQFLNINLMFNIFRKNKESHSFKNKDILVNTKELTDLQRYAKSIDMFNVNKVWSVQNGSHLSNRLSGRGMEFADIREYAYGDDIRSINWNIMARTGVPHTKLYQEEKERSIYVLVDMSKSMQFGTKNCFKSVLAAKVAALVAWCAVENGDRIGGNVFGDSSNIEVRPIARRQGVSNFIRALVSYKNNPISNGTNPLEDALKRLIRVIKKGAIVFVISDYYQLNNNCNKYLSVLKKHNQVIANFIYDPIEQTIPINGLFSLSNGEQFFDLDISDKKSKQKYENIFIKRLNMIYEIMNIRKINTIEFCTNKSIINTLYESLSVKG